MGEERQRDVERAAELDDVEELVERLHRACAELGGSEQGGHAEAPQPSVLDALGPLAHASDDLLVCDLDGHVITANPGGARRLGYAPSELCGRALWDLSLRHSAASFPALVSSLRKDGARYLFGHNRCKDGTVYPTEAHVWLAPFRGRECFFELSRDAGAFRGLLEERDQLAHLLQCGTDAVAIVSGDGLVRYANASAQRLFELPRLQDVVGRPLVDLLPEAQRGLWHDEILPAARRTCWSGELWFRDPRSGKTTTKSVRVFALRRAADDGVLGYAFVAHDVTAEKENEARRRALLELESLSHRVTTALFFEDDIDRAIAIILGEAGTVLGAQRAFLCRYREDGLLLFRTHVWTTETPARSVDEAVQVPDPLGWGLGDLRAAEPLRIADTSRAALPADAPELLGGDARAALLLPVTIDCEPELLVCFVDTRGPRVWADQEVAILRLMVDAFSRSVERRIAQRERDRTQRELEDAVQRERAASRYKSEFLASMSHELRTPMNAIVAYAELLGRSGRGDAKQTLWVDKLEKSTSYLLTLINDVLDLSQIEAGELAVEIEDCPLAELIGEVVELLRGQAEEKLLELGVVWDGPIPEKLRTDPVRFKQILVNLVANGIKFTSQGSVKVYVTCEDEGERSLAIAVADTGIGIAPDALRDLFQPFSQVHDRRTTRFAGTGLGLDISRHLARLLGGDVTVSSELGAGSTFTLRLPAKALVPGPLVEPPRAQAPRPVADRFQGPFLRGVRVLVVDDSEENREVLRFLLADAGAVCHTAANGAAGVDAARAAAAEGKAFDLVLMDLSMPGLDGFEATRTLRAEGVPGRVIALSALTAKEDRDAALAAGCADALTKPIVPTVFFETLARHVGTERLRGPIPSTSLPFFDDPRFTPLVARYVATFAELAAKLRIAHELGSLEEVRLQAHRLRGTAANYGFPNISTVAGECEDAIRARAGADEVAERVGALLALLHAAAA